MPEPEILRSKGPVAALSRGAFGEERKPQLPPHTDFPFPLRARSGGGPSWHPSSCRPTASYVPESQKYILPHREITFTKISTLHVVIQVHERPQRCHQLSRLGGGGDEVGTARVPGKSVLYLNRCGCALDVPTSCACTIVGGTSRTVHPKAVWLI